ncbi:MAG: M23 family metallopeptidase [Anaerolineae bacterium]|nr:M23 family metallopeptidase [Anaerolineae bacterium]
MTQPFRARPEYYRQFACEGRPFPGHEGIDIHAPIRDGQGSKVYAGADGVTHAVQQTDDGDPYGVRVRINHRVGNTEYQTVYAHLSAHSILVRPGDPVAAGQEIARSGNTGNTGDAAPHLHLMLKKTGATAAGKTDFPCDLIDPTPHLFWPDLLLTPTDVLRVRAEPNTESAILGLVTPGDALAPLAPDAVILWDLYQPGAWIKVQTPTTLEGYCYAEFLEIVGVPPEVPPLPVGRFVAGLHGRADGPMQEPDFTAVEVSKVEAVKLTTNALPADVTRLRKTNPDMFVVVRLFESFSTPAGPRKITAEEFANKFRPNPPGQSPTDLQRFYEMGVQYYEVHNEPNLTNEGFGQTGSWNSGAAFAAWYLAVIDRLRAWFPDARWGFPGLSPGDVVPGRPMAMWDFLDECEDAIAASDWLGVHQYFKDFAEMEDGFNQIVKRYRRRWPDKLLMVTEFSNPIKGVPKMVKGQQYVTYYRMAEEVPGLGAAFAYVVSASAPEFQDETWREESGAITPIPEAVSKR